MATLLFDLGESEAGRAGLKQSSPVSAEPKGEGKKTHRGKAPLRKRKQIAFVAKKKEKRKEKCQGEKKERSNNLKKNTFSKKERRMGRKRGGNLWRDAFDWSNETSIPGT